MKLCGLTFHLSLLDTYACYLICQVISFKGLFGGLLLLSYFIKCRVLNDTGKQGEHGKMNNILEKSEEKSENSEMLDILYLFVCQNLTLRSSVSERFGGGKASLYF